MTEIEVKDTGGQSMKLIDLGPYKTSKYGHAVNTIVDIHRELPNFEFRDDDILIASYPKTGCTWTHEIVSLLLQGDPEGYVVNKMTTMLEAARADSLAGLTSPRLINTHIPYERLPSSLHQHKVRILFVLRNPKDAAVSLYNMMTGMEHYHYSGKFEHWLPLYIDGKLQYAPYYEYVKEWEDVYDSKVHKILILHYEDMKKVQDTVREIRRIVDFLGVSISDNKITSISQKCQFDEMRTRLSAVSFGTGHFKQNSKGFMRKGKVGDWKHWFTIAQSEHMDKVFKQHLVASKFYFKYS